MTGTPPPSQRPVSEKSSVEEIKTRFDNDVDRFSNLETGQAAAIDSALCLELISQGAAATTPEAQTVLDIGCGAGNYTLKLLELLPNRYVQLIDLSQPMLERAKERISAISTGGIETMQGDVRELPLAENSCDIILAASVLHHLRSEAEWRSVCEKFFKALRNGGSLWVYDLVESADPELNRIMYQQYAGYLTQLKDAEYQQQVFDYIAQEDTPMPLLFQLDLLKAVGFARVEVLHKHACFAAYCVVKG